MNALKRRFPLLTETRLHLAVLAFLLVVPFISTSPYIIFMASAALFYSMVVMALNVINNAGVWNLAHATFLALGGYTAGFLAKSYGISPWIGIPIGGILAGLVSVVVMVPTLRLHQHYLMIATFNLALIGTITFTNWVEVTNGTAGMSGIPPIKIPWLIQEGGRLSLAVVPAIRPGQQYYVVLLGMILTYLVVYRLDNSPLGITIRAMREDDLAAQSMGHDTRRLRLLAMGLGSTLVGMAGGIFAIRFLSISPAASSLDDSVLYMVMLIVGGSGNIYGAIAGASILSVLPELLRGLQSYRLLVYGVILLAMMLFRPQGLIPERVRRLEIDEDAEPKKTLEGKKKETAETEKEEAVT